MFDLDRIYDELYSLNSYAHIETYRVQTCIRCVNRDYHLTSALIHLARAVKHGYPKYTPHIRRQKVQFLRR
jgi:hypothetical protein